MCLLRFATDERMISLARVVALQVVWRWASVSSARPQRGQLVSDKFLHKILVFVDRTLCTSSKTWVRSLLGRGPKSCALEIMRLAKILAWYGPSFLSGSGGSSFDTSASNAVVSASWRALNKIAWQHWWGGGCEVIDSNKEAASRVWELLDIKHCLWPAYYGNNNNNNKFIWGNNNNNNNKFIWGTVHCNSKLIHTTQTKLL